MKNSLRFATFFLAFAALPLFSQSSAENPRLKKAFDAMAMEFPTDTHRVYVLGHSIEGFGTWTAVTEEPQRFAALIASDGWPMPWVDVSRIKDLPMWVFQGVNDKPAQTTKSNLKYSQTPAGEAASAPYYS